MARKWICPFVKATHSAFQPQIAWLVISGSFCALPSDLHLGFLYRSPTKDNDGFFSNLTAKVTEWSAGNTNRLIFGDWNVHVPKGSDSFTPIAHEFMECLEANCFSLGTYTHGDSGEPTYGLPRPFTRPDHWIYDPGLPCPVLATMTPVDDGVCDHSALSCSIFIRKPPMLKALDLEKGKGCGLWGSPSASPPAEKLTHPGEDGWVTRVVPQNHPLRWKTTKGDLFCSKFRQILPNLLPRLSSCHVGGAADELIAHIRSTASHPHIQMTASPHPNKCRDAPWFSHELRILRTIARWHARHGHPTAHEHRQIYDKARRRAQRAYSRTIRNKVDDMILAGESHVFPTFFRLVRPSHPSPISKGTWEEYLLSHFKGHLWGKPPVQPLPHVDFALMVNKSDIYKGVLKYIRRVTPHTSKGFLDPPIAFLKARSDAEPHAPKYVMVEPLTELFASILRYGKIPRLWNLTKILPIFKKGCPLTPANYRLLAVSGCLYRILASVIKDMLLQWAFATGTLPPSQFGFLPGRGTMDPLFLLFHCLQTVRAKQLKSLFVAFVDFTTAYDMVDRSKLWDHLHKLHVPPHLLRYIQMLYHENVYILKDGLVTQGISPTRGLKQGCPLSPLLFAIYICDLPMAFPDKKVGARTLATDVYIPHVEFADDLTLMSNTAPRLQSLLNQLSSYAEEKGLEVSTFKTVAMAFGSQRDTTTFQYRGTEIRRVTDFKYLGLCLSTSFSLHRVTSHTQALFLAGIRKATSYASQYGTSRVAATHLRLFQQYGLSSGFYGAQLWSLPWLAVDTLAPQERHYNQFMRSLIGVGRKAKMAAVLQECGVAPLKLYWWRLVIRFWNHLVGHNSPLIQSVLEADRHYPGSKTWSGKLRKAAVHIKAATAYGAITMGSKMEVGLVLRDVQDEFIRAQGDVSLHYREHRSVLSFYWSCIQSQPRVGISSLFERKKPDYFKVALGSVARSHLARFRLRSFGLRFSKSAWVNNLGRECPLCNQGVQDEEHALFECSFEGVVALRARFQCLFAGQTLRTFLCQNPKTLAKFLIELAKALESDGLN